MIFCVSFTPSFKSFISNTDVAKTRQDLEKNGIENPFIQIMDVNSQKETDENNDE